jgi:hypothetical protein
MISIALYFSFTASSNCEEADFSVEGDRVPLDDGLSPYCGVGNVGRVVGNGVGNSAEGIVVLTPPGVGESLLLTVN